MTNATASPKVDRTIRLRDELRMAYCEWGDLDGRPVVLLTFPDAGHLFPISHRAEMLAALRFGCAIQSPSIAARSGW